MSNITENLAKFLDKEGRVTRWPARRHVVVDTAAIIAYLATKFEADRKYTETEVNAILNQWHTFGDWALLRRELFERHYLDRTKDGREYWVRTAQPET